MKILMLNLLMFTLVGNFNSPTQLLKLTTKTLILNEAHSFVISCGSGCALTYNLNEKKFFKKENKIMLSFKVKMFVDEELINKYNEVYIGFKKSDRLVIMSENEEIISKTNADKLYLALKKIFCEEFLSKTNN